VPNTDANDDGGISLRGLRCSGYDRSFRVQAGIVLADLVQDGTTSGVFIILFGFIRGLFLAISRL
jgi:hypothetical protein